MLVALTLLGCSSLDADRADEAAHDGGANDAAVASVSGDDDGDDSPALADAGDAGAGDDDNGCPDGSASCDDDAGTLDGATGTVGNHDPVVASVDVLVDGLGATATVDARDEDMDLERVELSWGDGLSDTVDMGVGDIQVSHTYDAPGSYDLDVTATDSMDNTGSAQTTVTTGIPRDGLLLELLLDNDGDDTSGEGRNATVSRGTYTVDRFNQGFSAVDLWNGNSTGSEGLISTELVPFSDSFTLALWIAANTNGNDYRILGQGQWVNLFFAGTALQLGIQSGLYADSGGYQLATSSIHPQANLSMPEAWTLYAVTVERTGSSSTVRIYQDGQEVVSDDSAPVFVNPGLLDPAMGCRFYVGHEPDGAGCNDTQAAEFGTLPAFVDDVRVYDRALSPAEIQALYQDGDWPGCCED